MTASAKDLNQKTHLGQSAIDARLRRITDEILPSSPYILTLPTNYRVGSHQINDWRRGTPFAPHEEQLSYLSFLARTFDEDNIMNAIGDWDDGKGAIKEKNPHGRSGTSSPLPGQAPKKKISLADYKNKTAGQTGAKTLPQTSGPAKAPNKDSIPATPAERMAKSKEIEKPPSHKRSIDAVSESKEVDLSNNVPVQPPAKKARISPDPTPAPQAMPKAPEVKNTNLHGLPPLLSPTLPLYVEEELEKAQVNVHGLPEKLGHERTSSMTSTSSDKKGPATTTNLSSSSKAAIKDVAQISHKPKNDILTAKKSLAGQSVKVAASSHQVSDPKHNTSKHISARDQRITTSNGVTNGKFLPIASGKIGKEQLGSSVVSSGKLDEKHVLVLKIPKASRKAWGRIIKMTPRPKKPESTKDTPVHAKDTLSDRAKAKPIVNGAQGNDGPRQQGQHPHSSHTTTKVIAGKHVMSNTNERDASKVGEKRRRPEDERDTLAPPSGKRQKAVNISDSTPKPSTPVRAAIKSPILSHNSSAQKPQPSDPRRDLKSSAMRRVESTEGDVKTPLGATRSSTPNAPASTERVSRHDRSASNASASTNSVAGKAEEIAFWKAEQRKYLDLGRTLKHDADPYLNSNSEYSIVDDDLKQGAAIVTETVLCYMLGFSLGDEASRLARKFPDAAMWGSLLPYMKFVKNVTRLIPALHGLVYQLEAVCRETILLYDLERLKRETFSPAVSDDFEGFRNGLVDNSEQAQHAWVQGANLLPEDVLHLQYPSTWANRVDTPLVPKGKEKLVPKAYGDGGYHLPLRTTNSGIEAVRMGWSLLGEWSTQEGVKWVGKIGL